MNGQNLAVVDIHVPLGNALFLCLAIVVHIAIETTEHTTKFSQNCKVVAMTFTHPIFHILNRECLKVLAFSKMQTWMKLKA